MEERIMDDDGRLIKIKKTKLGDDAVEETVEGEGGETPETEADDEFTVEFADDDNYDEGLVGLTPTQLKEELERRERIKREAEEACAKNIEEGNALLAQDDYEGAEKKFSTAVSFVSESEEAHRGLWTARTHNYTSLEGYYDEDNAREFLSCPEKVKAEVLERDGEKLIKARAALKEEIAPLEKDVLDKRQERREPLRNNKNYYRVRLLVLLALTLCFAVAALISLDYTFRTTVITPIITASVFGGLAVIVLVLAVVYVRLWLVAARLYNANEDLASTEDGRKLLDLRHKEACLALLLDREEEETEEDGE